MPENTKDWSGYMTHIIKTDHPLAHQILTEFNTELATISRYQDEDYPQFCQDVDYKMLIIINQILNQWKTILPTITQNQWSTIIDNLKLKTSKNRLHVAIQSLTSSRMYYNFEITISDYDKYYQLHDVTKNDYGQIFHMGDFEMLYHQLQKLEIKFIELLHPSTEVI